jgi:NADH dehydrogenase
MSLLSIARIAAVSAFAVYQVATRVLSPADIADAVLLLHQANATVLLADMAKIDTPRRLVITDGERLKLPSDFLIVATSARHSYFGHPEWEPITRRVRDARQLRRPDACASPSLRTYP